MDCRVVLIFADDPLNRRVIVPDNLAGRCPRAPCCWRLQHHVLVFVQSFAEGSRP
jgi:hypothetical protein